MNELKKAREKAGLTQKQAAQAAGISEQAYQSYERGRTKPLVDKAVKLAHALNSTVENLYPQDNQEKH